MKTTRAGVNRTSKVRPPLGKPKRPEKLLDEGSEEDSSGYDTESSEHVSERRPIAFSQKKPKTNAKLKKPPAPSEPKGKSVPDTKRKAEPPKKAPKAKRTRKGPSESDRDQDSDLDNASGDGKSKGKKRKVSEAKKGQKKSKRPLTPPNPEPGDEQEPATSDPEPEDEPEPATPKVRSVCSQSNCKIHQIRTEKIPVHKPPSRRGRVVRSACSQLDCKIHQIRARKRRALVEDETDEEDQEENRSGESDAGNNNNKLEETRVGDGGGGELKKTRMKLGKAQVEDGDNDELEETRVEDDDDELEETRVEDDDEQDEEDGQGGATGQGGGPSGGNDADADNDETEDGDEQHEEEGQDQGENRSGESDGDAGDDENGDEQEEEEDQDGTPPTVKAPSNSKLSAPLLPPPGGSGLGESSRELNKVPESPLARLRYEPDPKLFDPLLKGLETDNPIEALINSPIGGKLVDWHLGASRPQNCPECKFDDALYSYRPCFHDTCRQCWYKIWDKVEAIGNKEEYAGAKCQFCKKKVDYVVQVTSRNFAKASTVVVYEVPKKLRTGEDGHTEVRRYRYAPF